MSAEHSVAGRATARSAFVLVAVLITVVSLGGYLPDAAEHSATQQAASKQSVLALGVLAMVAVFVIGVSVLSFVRRTAIVADLPQDRESVGRLRNRISARQLIIVAAVVVGTAGAAAAIYQLAPRTVADRQTQQSAPAQADPTHQGEPAPDRRTPAPVPLNDMDFRFLGIAAGVTALASVAAIGTVVVRSTRRRSVRTSPEEAASGMRAAIARGAALGIAETADLHQDPRSAVIACYRVLEQEFAAVAGLSPAASDTPSEVLARAVELGVVDGDTATRLVALFAEARFSAHRMTERHREAATLLLYSVLTGLRRERGR
ncbi:DUF4129 domain-containing protein [Nocardia sp. NPDC046473]|uniref:DUF4129 domain-containing protein n=1 Tax=Nocardia sp. NPDC046473 TaxID=3155733 RepID=UPI00340ADC92